MEKRIVQKVNDYIMNIKTTLIDELESSHEKNDYTQLSSYIHQLESINLDKSDFTKRNRAKNTIPLNDRCMARRASGEQCTRRKGPGCEYCGTHIKGVPHGIINKNNQNKYKKQEVWAEDINGIIYYIDKNNNVYKTEDILNNVVNPRIIYKWKLDNKQYSLYPIS